MSNLAKIWAKWVMNHRFTSMALVVLGALLLGMGAKDAQFSANQRDFFKPDDKNLNNLIRIEEELGRAAYNGRKEFRFLG